LLNAEYVFRVMLLEGGTEMWIKCWGFYVWRDWGRATAMGKKHRLLLKKNRVSQTPKPAIRIFY